MALTNQLCRALKEVKAIFPIVSHTQIKKLSECNIDNIMLLVNNILQPL